MTPNKRPPIVRDTDPGGNPIIRVPLDPKGSRWAMLDAADYDTLPDAIRLASWLANSSGNGFEYVKVGRYGSPGHLVSMSRVILRARRGQAVYFKSNDRCDLRRSNMYVKKDGRAKRDHLLEIVGNAAAA